MKKIQFLLLGLLITAASFAHDDEKDPIVLTIDGEGIHKSEFLYIYTKNNPNPSYKSADLDEYMELFINYKLKVKEAENLGYDTIPKLNTELATYRKQLSQPYMVDKNKNEKLIKEAYDRTITEVRASHILIRLIGTPTPVDTLNAYNKCMAIKKRIEGGEDFGAVAASTSEDPSAKTNQGDLGYFSALQMVYPFEQAAFTTNVGEVSDPIRTRFGYHLIKVVDQRKANGRIKTSHIMILSNAETSDPEKKIAEEKIKEIHSLLLAGEDFAALATKYSDDQSSKSKGGLLPEFGAGSKQRMVPEFEAAAFALKNDGDFSEPIQTPYGWHIIKRMEMTPVASYDDMYRELKLKVEKDMRAQTTKNAFLDNLKKEYGYSEKDAAKCLTYFKEVTKEAMTSNSWKGLSDKSHNEEVMFSFKDQFYTVADFEAFILGMKTSAINIPMADFMQAQFDGWTRRTLMSYEDSQLESKYPEFKSLIQEYRDGILVFEIMQNEIWTKASQDSVGIMKYYDAHQNDFTYPVRYDGELYKCKDKSTAGTVVEYIETDTMTYGQIQELVNKNSQLNLTVKKHIFNSETTEAFKKGKKIRKFKKGVNKTFVMNDEYYVFKVNEVLQPRNREFKEAKGLVTAAYQNQLEKEWLANLRKSHKIEIHKDALYAVGD